MPRGDQGRNRERESNAKVWYTCTEHNDDTSIVTQAYGRILWKT